MSTVHSVLTTSATGEVQVNPDLLSSMQNWEYTKFQSTSRPGISMAWINNEVGKRGKPYIQLGTMESQLAIKWDPQTKEDATQQNPNNTNRNIVLTLRAEHEPFFKALDAQNQQRAVDMQSKLKASDRWDENRIQDRLLPTMKQDPEGKWASDVRIKIDVNETELFFVESTTDADGNVIQGLRAGQYEDSTTGLPNVSRGDRCVVIFYPKSMYRTLQMGMTFAAKKILIWRAGGAGSDLSFNGVNLPMISGTPATTNTTSPSKKRRRVEITETKNNEDQPFDQPI